MGFKACVCVYVKLLFCGHMVVSRWLEFDPATSDLTVISGKSSSAIGTDTCIDARSAARWGVGTASWPAVAAGSRTDVYAPSSECMSPVSDVGNHATWERPQRSYTVAVEPTAPNGDRTCDVACADAAVADLVVPRGDNGNHFDECCVRSYGSSYLCLTCLLAV